MMDNSSKTTDLFDRLPYEVLEHIAEYLDDSKDTRQFQLLNKRCQGIVEKSLFELLTLVNRYSAHSVLNFALFLMEPRRCKLVKRLIIEGNNYMNLSYRFFDEFCNITSVDFELMNANMDWKYFNETFTPDRCKLKKLPHLAYNFDRDEDVNDYRTAVENHSQTLELLDSAYFPNRSYNFPRVKTLLFSWIAMDSTMQDVDYAISNCPLLEQLEIESSLRWGATGRHLGPFVPDKQHQPLMKKISVCIEPDEFLDMCNYLTAKFVNVQEWELNRGHTEFFPFEEFIDAFHLIMKSTRVELEMHTEYSSVPRIYSFLTLYNAYTNVSINQLICQGDIRDEDIPVSMELLYNRSKSTLNATSLTYASGEFQYLELIKRTGHGLQNLNLSLLDYDYNNPESTGEEYILQGDVLVQLLDSCSSLISFTYFAKALRSIGERTRNAVSKSLRQLVLECDIIDPEALVEISYIAPGLVDLTIDSYFSDWALSSNRREILINMPNSYFDRLVLEDCYIQRDNEEIILVKVTSLSLSETKYYIQEYKGEKVKVLANTSDEEEYSMYPDPFGGLHCTKIAITCQSVKCIEYHSYHVYHHQRVQRKSYSLFSR